MFTYYTIMRPPMPGAIPKNGLVEMQDYGVRKYCKQINREAWGEVTYDRELTQQEIASYELAAALDYDDTVTLETYPDPFIDTDCTVENELFDHQIREFTVPRAWAAEFVYITHREALDEFITQHTMDDTMNMYNYALLENVLAGERIVGKE